MLTIAAKTQADNPTLDSLRTALAASSSEMDRASTLVSIGMEFGTETPDSALHYFELAQGIPNLSASQLGKMYAGLGLVHDRLNHDSLSIHYHLLCFEQQTLAKDTAEMASAAQRTGRMLINTGKQQEAIPWLHNAIELAAAVDAASTAAIAYSNLGIAHYYSGDVLSASEAFIAAVHWYDTHNMEVSAALLINLSAINRELTDWAGARKYAERALQIALADSNISLARMCYQNIGTIHTQLKSYDLAEEYLNKANEINLQRNDSSHISRYYTGMADNYQAQGDIEATIIHYLQAKQTLPATAEPRQLMFAYLNLARAYNEQAAGTNKAYLSLAVENALIAHEMADNIGLTKNKSECSELLFRAYAALNEPGKAVHYGTEFIAIHDSLLTEEKVNAVAELHQRYEAEKREAEIEALSAQNAIKSENLKQADELQANQRLIIILLGLGIGLTALLLVWIFRINRQRQKANAILADKNTTIEAQNQEKETLLKEIHHRVKNNLQVISSLLDLQSDNIEDATALSALEDGQSRVRSMALIHQFLYQKEDIGSIPFSDYARDLARQIASVYTDVKPIDLQLADSTLTLDIDTAVPIGLILNELITNAYKHAFHAGNGTKLRIELTETSEGNFELLVADNGPGLPADFNLAKTSSLGLRLVRRLSMQLYGTANYSSDGGAQFRVLFKSTAQRELEV